MKLQVVRFSSQEDSTLGLLFDVTDGNREFLVFTLEDEHREEKVYGETRVPAGEYKVTLRTTGGFHSRYARKYGGFHRGMLWVRDVPNFEYILIHTGNTDDHTAGCLLVGDHSQQNITKEGFIGSSVDAYRRIYPDLADAAEDGDLTIEYVDFDIPNI